LFPSILSFNDFQYSKVGANTDRHIPRVAKSPPFSKYESGLENHLYPAQPHPAEELPHYWNIGERRKSPNGGEVVAASCLVTNRTLIP
jgi:hypothetical protein